MEEKKRRNRCREATCQRTLVPERERENYKEKVEEKRQRGRRVKGKTKGVGDE